MPGIMDVIKQFGAAREPDPQVEAQIARLRELMPLAGDEATAKADASVEKLRRSMFDLGYKLRSQRTPDFLESQVKRHEVAPLEGLLPKKAGTAAWFDPRLMSEQAKQAGLLSALAAPVEEQASNVWETLRRKRDELLNEGSRVTSNPGTLPSFYPTAAISGPAAFIEGYRKADADVAARINSVLDTRLAEARRQFQKALDDEYAMGSQKAASFGQLVDGLAQTHVKGAAGELNQAAGLYLALASLLGMGSHQVAKGWMTDRDPRYQRQKAIEQLFQQKDRSEPAVAMMEPPDKPVTMSL